MRRLERLVNLIALLSDTSRPLSQREIVEQVPGYDTSAEAARRLFERDKVVLRDLGFSLQAESIDTLRGFAPGNIGYRLPVGNFVTDPGLTLEEKSALAVASAAVWGYLPNDSMEVETPATNIASVACAGKVSPADSSEQKPRDDGRAAQSLPSPPKLLEVFLRAVSDCRQLVFAYRSGTTGAVSRRQIHPYGLAFRRGRWYVTGLDLDSGDLRTFRLDRVKGDVSSGGAHAFAFPTAQTFAPVPDRGWSIGTGPKILVRMAVDPEWMWWVGPQAQGRETGQNIVVEGTNWPVLQVIVRHEEAFLSWVLSLLDRVILLAPASLRAEVCRRLDEMANSRLSLREIPPFDGLEVRPVGAGYPEADQLGAELDSGDLCD